MWLVFPYLAICPYCIEKDGPFQNNNAFFNNEVVLPNLSKLIFLKHEGGHSNGMSEHCSIIIWYCALPYSLKIFFEYSLEIMVNLQG